MLFLLTFTELRPVEFSCLLNPDWSIQISAKVAVRKAVSGQPKEMWEGSLQWTSTSSRGNNNYNSRSKAGMALMVYA